LDKSGMPTTLRGHERNIWAVQFSPDGKQLASGSFDHTARLWDSATGKPLKTLRGHEQAVVSLAFSPDGKLLATSGDDSTIRLWRMPDGAALRTVNSGNHTYSVAFSPDGKWLISGGRARGTIGTFWHQKTGSGGMTTPVQVRRRSDMAVVAVLPHPDDVMGTAFSLDGRWLVTSGEDNRFRLWALRER
jgi:WD40 repeat protein